MKLCSLCNQYFDDIQGICPIDRTPLETVENDRLIGALICDRYVVDSVIGKGASGIVYKARRMQRGDVVAIKVLHNQLGAESNSLDRFLREAIAASKLRNPHIITIWDSGVTDDGQPFFVMDYLEGITLGRLIKETSHLPYGRILSILKQVTDALGEAHKQGIIHRDLKPENIILQITDTGQDFVKVLDFGVSDLPAESARVDKPKSVAGSPAYMSPEQCQGFQLDARSDIYSLGIVLFELLTGRRPFRVDDYVSLMFLHVSEPPMKLAEARPDINYSPALQAVITKALAKVPSQRQASVEELYQELESALASAEEIQVSPQANNGASGQFDFPAGDQANPRGTADNGHSQIDNQNATSARNDTADMEPISVTQTELTLGAGSSINLTQQANQAAPSNTVSKSNLRNVFAGQIEEEEQSKSKPKQPKAKSSISGIASPFKAMAMATQTLVGFAVPALKPKGKEGTEAPQSVSDVIDLNNALTEMPVQELSSTSEVTKSKNPSKHSLPAMGLNSLLSVLESRPSTPPPVPEAGGPKSLSDLLKNGRRTGSNTAIPPQQTPAAQSVPPSFGYPTPQEQIGAFPNPTPTVFEIQQASSVFARDQAFGNNEITPPVTPSAPESAGGNGQSSQRPLKFTATKQDMLAPQRIEVRKEESAALVAPIEPPPVTGAAAIEPRAAEETNAWPEEIPASPVEENVSTEPVQSFEIPPTANEAEVPQQNFAPCSVEPVEAPLATPELDLETNPPVEAASQPAVQEVNQSSTTQLPLNKLTTTGGQPRKPVAPLVRQSQANPPLNAPPAKNDARGAAVSPELQKRTQEMVVNSLNSLASQYQQKAGDNTSVKQSGAYGVRQSSSFPKPASPIRQSGAFAKDGATKQSGAFAKDVATKQSGAFAKDGPLKQSGAFPKESPVRQSGAFPKPAGSSSVRQSGSFLPSSEQRFLAAAPYSTSKPSEGSIARMVDEVDVAPQSAPAVEVNAGTVVFEHDPASLQDLGAAAWGHFTTDESEASAEAAALVEGAPEATPEGAVAYFDDEVSSFLTQPDVVQNALPEVPLPPPPTSAAAPLQVEFTEDSSAVNDFVQPTIPAAPIVNPPPPPQPKANVKPQQAVSPFQGMEQAHRTSRLPASDVQALKDSAKEPPKPPKLADVKADESISDMLIALSIDHDPAALEQPPPLLDQDQSEDALSPTMLEEKPSGPTGQTHQSLAAAAAATRAAQSETTPEIMPKPRKSPYVTIGESDLSTPIAQSISGPTATPQNESLKDLLVSDAPKEAPKSFASETPQATQVPTLQSSNPSEFPKEAPVIDVAKPQQTPKLEAEVEEINSPEISQPPPGFDAVTSVEIPKIQPGVDAVTSTEIAQVPSPKASKSLELMPKTPENLIDFFKDDTFKVPESSKKVTPVNRDPTPRELFAYEPNRAQSLQPPAELPPESPTGTPGDLSKLLDSLESVGKERPTKQQGTPIDLPAFGIGKPSENKQAAPMFDEVTMQEPVSQPSSFELTEQVVAPEPASFAPQLQDELLVNEPKTSKNNTGPGLNRLIEAAKRGPTSSKMQKSVPAKPPQEPQAQPVSSEPPRQPVDTNAAMLSQPSSFNNQAPSQNISQSMSRSGSQSRSVREMMESAGSSIKQEITGGFNHFSSEGGGDNFAQNAADLAAATSPEINRLQTGNPANPSGRALAGKDVGGISLILPPPAEFMSMEAPIHPKPNQPVYTDADYENMDSAQASDVVKQKYEAQLARKKGKSAAAWNETVATTRNRTASLRTKPGGMNFGHTFLIGAITISIAYACISVVVHMTQNNKAFAPTPVKPIKTLLQNKEYEQVRKILEKKQETSTLTKQDSDDLDTAYVNIAKDGVKAKKYEIAMTVAQKIGPKSARFNEAAKLLRQIKRLKKAQGRKSSG